MTLALTAAEDESVDVALATNMISVGLDISRVHRQGLVRDRYEDREGRRHPIVPVRFVQACPNGHIGDIDWPGFVHVYQKPPCLGPLWVEEWGTSGDLADIVIACECGRSRSMAQATRGPEALGFCTGQRPWLGPMASERCEGETGKAVPTACCCARPATRTSHRCCA